MAKHYQVIMSRCLHDRIFGDRLVDQEIRSEHEATKLANDLTKCGSGYSVILRPSFNETDAKGSFFREWRSFNGESLREVRWSI